MNVTAANSPEIGIAESCNNGQNFMQHALNRTCKMTKVIRVVTTVLKCFNSWKQKVLKAITSAVKFHVAKIVLVRSAQIESFGNMLSKMRQNLTFEEAVSAIPTQYREPWMSCIKKFVLYLDPDGILRVGGRLDYIEDMSDELKHPAILPKRPKITELFILDKHEHLAHCAAETALASLINDEGVKSIGGVQRHYLLDCFACKLLSKSRGKQLMAPLPEFRITPRQAVFTSISIDYAAPFEVKRGRSTAKRWICVFVCNATSAIRLEVVESLETSAFLNAFHRFECLSGCWCSQCSRERMYKSSKRSYLLIF